MILVMATTSICFILTEAQTHGNVKKLVGFKRFSKVIGSYMFSLALIYICIKFILYIMSSQFNKSLCLHTYNNKLND